MTWADFEKALADKIGGVSGGIIILLLIGALGGSWMVGGIVPTLIYYENGLEKNRLIENDLFSNQIINNFILQPFEQYNPRRSQYLYQPRNYY